MHFFICEKRYKTCWINFKKLLDTKLDSLKTAPKKVVHKARECLGNKIADAVTKSTTTKL